MTSRQSFRQLQTNANNFRQIQTDSDKFRQFQKNSDKFRPKFRQIQTISDKFRPKFRPKFRQIQTISEKIRQIQTCFEFWVTWFRHDNFPASFPIAISGEFSSQIFWRVLLPSFLASFHPSSSGEATVASPENAPTNHRKKRLAFFWSGDPPPPPRASNPPTHPHPPTQRTIPQKAKRTRTIATMWARIFRRSHRGFTRKCAQNLQF